MEESQPGNYGEKWNWTWVNSKTNNFGMVELSRIVYEADIFVQLFFINRTLLIAILMEKINSVVSGELNLITQKIQL